MKQNKFLSRKFLISLICILFLVLFAFLIIDGFFNLGRDEKIYIAGIKDMIDQRMTSLIFEINIFPGGAGGDVLFLSRLSCLREVAGITEIKSEHETEELAQDFSEFLKENPAYYQLRYIDEKGKEVIRTEFDGENYKVIWGEELQDKSLRYYFDKTMNLNEGEVYISPLDLNIENEKIENRGTQENPIYVPVIRFATPVFDNNGNKKGIIIANIYADYFLNDIRRAQRDEEIVVLINEEGYYLAHPNKSKEFSFMFDKEDNFYKDYPGVADKVLSDFNKRRIEKENLIFSYRYLYPTVESFEINAGSTKILGENPENRYFWILVTISDKSRMDWRLNELEKEYMYFLLFSGLIILIIFVLMFISFKLNGNDKGVKRK